jgi:hypothetical protein
MRRQRDAGAAAASRTRDASAAVFFGSTPSTVRFGPAARLIAVASAKGVVRPWALRRRPVATDKDSEQAVMKAFAYICTSPHTKGAFTVIGAIEGENLPNRPIPHDCIMCGRVHWVNPSTGHVTQEDEISVAAS